MNIKITTFTSPFSFFCKVESETGIGTGGNGGVVNMTNNNNGSADGGTLRNSSKTSRGKTDISDFSHGQYVAVTWKEKWVRGVVTMESQFLIWLVDYGFYLRPNEKTVIISLPDEYRKSPTKVFEASIHGVCPVDKVLTDDCQIINESTSTWNKGAIEKAQTLIGSAMATYFVPVALLNTKHNDIVLGHLYLQFMDRGFVNIVDELALWPVFLEKNETAFMKYLPVNYSSRRKHRASVLPPEFPDIDYKLPIMTLATSLQEYTTISANAPTFEPTCEYDSHSEDGTTVVTRARRNSDDEYKLTHAEVLKYSQMFVTINDSEYNVLSILLSKLEDLRMCARYKDHDLKRIGRACSRNRTPAEAEDE